MVHADRRERGTTLHQIWISEAATVYFRRGGREGHPTHLAVRCAAARTLCGIQHIFVKCKPLPAPPGAARAASPHRDFQTWKKPSPLLL
jgi:hypothetical protein